MGGGLLRNATVGQILRRGSIADITDPIGRVRRVFRSQAETQTRDFRIPNFLRKGREYEVSPSSFTAAFSSSSSSSAPAVSKAKFVGWYLGMVKSRPILTKSITSSIIYTAADLSSQTISGSSSEPYDFLRTLRMAGYGMIVLGPSLHFWFTLMSRKFPKRDLITTFKKMVLGQTTYGPVMTVIFLSLNASIQGENGDEIVARLKRDLLPTLLNGVMYWPVCDFITYRFVPVHLQPLVSNSFSFLWTIYMTYMAAQEKVSIATS